MSPWAYFAAALFLGAMGFAARRRGQGRTTTALWFAAAALAFAAGAIRAFG